MSIVPGRRAAALRPAAFRLLAFVLVLAPPAARADGLPPLKPAGSAVVREVLDGRTLALADGRQLRLVGIDVPSPGTGRDRPDPALAAAAKAALAGLVAGRTVALYQAGNPMDRYGRIEAHVVSGGVWVQGALLRRGLARVQSFADNRAGVAEMLALEREARRARRGIWADPFYAVRRPEEAGRYAGSFQIVEGTVVDGARVRGQVFLNFGPDWHTAFTLRIAGAALRLFRAAGLDPLRLKGARLRVRGYIDGGRRALIEVTHPEQIERL